MIRVFPRRTSYTPTDPLAFVGDVPLFRPPDQPVRISISFTWDIAEGRRLARSWSDFYSDVKIGGPAFGDRGDTFEPGQFVKEGFVFTSRGCVRKCPYCYISKREGSIRELPIKEGYIVSDNNLLACSRAHIKAVFDMLRRQSRAANFRGGLDSRLFNGWHREQIDTIKINELWFACDSQSALKPLERVAELLAGISIEKRRCYVLIGYRGETLAEAERRLQAVYALGFLPFAQLYRGEGPAEYSLDWLKLSKKWSRPALYRTKRGS